VFQRNRWNWLFLVNSSWTSSLILCRSLKTDCRCCVTIWQSSVSQSQLLTYIVECYSVRYILTTFTILINNNNNNNKIVPIKTAAISQIASITPSFSDVPQISLQVVSWSRYWIGWISGLDDVFCSHLFIFLGSERRDAALYFCQIFTAGLSCGAI